MLSEKSGKPSSKENERSLLSVGTAEPPLENRRDSRSTLTSLEMVIVVFAK
jgi:hypothetical protein